MAAKDTQNYRARLLFIDDSVSQLQLYRSQTEDLYQVSLGHTYEEAIASLSTNLPDLIVLDMVMPQVDGLEFLDILRHSPVFKNIPVIMVSAENDVEIVRQAFLKGASDYVRKPYDIEELRLRINRLLNQIPRVLSNQEAETTQLKTAKSLMIKALSDLAATRDNETGNHLNRIEKYVGILTLAAAKSPFFKMHITSSFLESMAELAILHDIGKVGIPDHILRKPAALNPEEYAIMKTHTTIGAETINRIKQTFPQYDFLDFATQIVRYHHERWDGTGYPDGIAEEAIPLCARIVSIADVFDALTTERVYKEAFSIETTMEIMKAERGKQFDPILFDIFVSCLDEFARIRDHYFEL